MSNWYCPPVEGEIPFEEIEERAFNGEFHEWNFEPFEMQENGYEDVVEQLKKYKAADYISIQESYKTALESGNTDLANELKEKMDSMVNEVLAIYRSKNIFPIQYYSDLGVMDEIEKCIAYKAKFDGNTVSCVPGDTMYYNGVMWKPIKDYIEGERVLQYNEDGTATLVNPLDYIHYESNEVFHSLKLDIHSSGNGCISMTGNHNVVYYDDFNKKSDNLVKKPLDDLLKIGEEIFSFEDVRIPTGGIYEGTVKEKQLVLSRVALNLVNQIYDDSSEYLSYVNDSVVLSDKCCELVLEDRKYLLAMLGVSEGYVEYVRNNYNEYFIVSYLHGISRDTLESINTIIFLTYRDMYIDYVYDDNKVVELVNGDTHICVNKVYNTYYEKDKYCFTVPSGMLVLKRNNFIFITGNCGAGVGTGLCRWLFPNIFDTPSAHDLNKKDAESQYKKFLNDEYLKRAIKFCFSYKDGCPVPTSVEGGLRLVGSAPSNFRPMNAKAVYERFCPKGGTIFDPCCGFGGRMLGALSSKNNYKYVGTDPCTESMYHLHQLGEYIEQVTGRDDSYELHCCGSEDFVGKPNSVDFAFSSPPYFNLEVYSDEPTQCYNKFPKLEDWLEGYVRQTIKNIYNMLKPGCFYAINIADFKVNSGQVVAYVDEWIRISTEENMPLFDTVYLGVTARAGSKEQAAGELKKENILVFKKPL